MQRARVLGQVVSTARHPTLAKASLRLVQPLGPGGRPDGEPLVVADTVGVANGEVAIISSDGKAAQELFGRNTPLRYTVVGTEDMG